MKFDYVIGNPPYQEEAQSESLTNGQKPRKNIFHHFQLQADVIAKQCSVLIYPGGRWLHQSGKGLKNFGYEQINDERLASVVFYPEASEVFGSVADLADGITIVVKKGSKRRAGFDYVYMLNDKPKTIRMASPGMDLMPLNPDDYAIVQKIKQFVQNYQLSFLHDKILPRTLFGIESDFIAKNPQGVRPYTDGEKINVKKEVLLLTNDKAGKAGRSKWFIIPRKSIRQNQALINQYQVVVSSANAGGQKRDNQIEIIAQNAAFGRVRVALQSFKTLREAQNFYNYACSYIVRFAFLMTDEALSSLGRYVPDLGCYSNDNTMVDFSENIDKQLFRLMGLTEDEVSYVRKKIDNLR